MLVLGAGRHAGDNRLLRALVQPLPTPADGGQELLEVDLERREDAVGPVLHLELRLAGLPAGVVGYLLRPAPRALVGFRPCGLAQRPASRPSPPSGRPP